MNIKQICGRLFQMLAASLLASCATMNNPRSWPETKVYGQWGRGTEECRDVISLKSDHRFSETVTKWFGKPSTILGHWDFRDGTVYVHALRKEEQIAFVPLEIRTFKGRLVLYPHYPGVVITDAGVCYQYQGGAE